MSRQQKNNRSRQTSEVLSGPLLTGRVTRTHGRHHYVTTQQGEVFEAHRRGKKSDVVVGDIVTCSQPECGG